ncbi:MAG TPA: hypothetical protein VFO76_04695 [Candidatus Kapabacteria bacterium]|nr:hypothetical protein [Candidatus Kapabacteria bacterium]
MNRFLHILFATVFVLWSTASKSVAQEYAVFGPYFHYTFDFHSANFQQLPGVPSCCPRYGSGSGNTIGLGFLSLFPLTNQFEIGVRGGYEKATGILSRTEETTVFNNGPVTGAFEHTLNVTMTDIIIEPMLGYRLINGLIVHLGISTRILLSTTYDQAETIVKPQDAGTFLDSTGSDTHSRIRNQYSGEIPGVSSLQFALTPSIAYRLPLDNEGSFFLQPELSYVFGLTSIGKDLDWKVNSFRLSLAIVTTNLTRPPSKEK